MENSKSWLELQGLIALPNGRLGFEIHMINDD